MRRNVLVRVVAIAVLVCVYVFILLPLLVTFAFSFSKSRFMSFPLSGLSLHWYAEVLQNEAVLRALGNSFLIGLCVAATATVLGFLGAYGLTRWRTRFREPLGLFFISPLAVPWIFLGLGLLLFFGFIGLPKSLLAVYIGHSVFAVPMALMIIRSSLERVARNLEEAALDLGCRPFRAAFMILAPSVRPSLLAAFLISFTLSFDEFIMAWFVTGFDVTLPVYIWGKVKTGMSPEVNVIGVIVLTLSLTFGLITQRIIAKRSAS